MAVFIIPWASVFFLCVMLVICNAVTLSIECFGVDSQNRVYVSHPSEIRVYEDGIPVNQIPAQTSRGYMFSVLPNDTILLSTATKVYTMDLSGNILNQQEDIGTHTYNEIQRNRKEVTSSQGDYYRIRNSIGRTKIVKNGIETVYQISILSVIVKSLMVLCIVLFVLFIVGNVIHTVVS